MIINDDNTIAKYEKMVLQLKEYFIKIMSSSAIIYAFAGKNFIKMFVEFKVRQIFLLLVNRINDYLTEKNNQNYYGI